jgi:hypothetical protein
MFYANHTSGGSALDKNDSRRQKYVPIPAFSYLISRTSATEGRIASPVYSTRNSPCSKAMSRYHGFCHVTMDYVTLLGNMSRYHALCHVIMEYVTLPCNMSRTIDYVTLPCDMSHSTVICHVQL